MPQITPSSPSKIVVILPVYAGKAATLRAVHSLLDSRACNQCAMQICLINDASPEPNLVQALIDLAAQTQAFTLVHQPVNQGFVKTVNAGIRAADPLSDVVLLNADTEVSGNWLDKLRFFAQQDGVATVTPLSNHATLASYPRFCHGTPLPAGESVASLNCYAELANAKQSQVIPTGVGFCLYINRCALDQVGLLDEAAFGRGYGEETDFCLRASAKGFCHLLALDTVVYHEGSVSFSDAADDLRRAGQNVLRARYPDFEAQNTRFMLDCPLQHAFAKMDLLRFYHSQKPLLLFVLHAHAGGTEKHAKDLAQFLAQQPQPAQVLFLQPDATGLLKLYSPDTNEDFALFFERQSQSIEQLIELLRLLRLERIHYHHVIGLEPALLQLPERLDVPFDFTAHDYFSVCPNVHLLDRSGYYCGEPYRQTIADKDETANVQNGCLCQRQQPDQGAWINRWRAWLASAERIFVPSHDTGKRLQAYFPELTFTVATHPEPTFTSSLCTLSPAPNQPPLTDAKTAKPLTILLIGTLSPFKGADLLKEAVKIAQIENLPLAFHLLGQTTDRQRNNAKLTVHGRYQDTELMQRIHDLNVDVVWLPFLWPETHSFTLSAAMLAGLPIVSTRIGAIPERLVDYPQAFLQPIDTTARQWVAFFMGYHDGENQFPHQGNRSQPAEIKTDLLATDAFRGKLLTADYQQDYLRPARRTTAKLDLVEQHVLLAFNRYAIVKQRFFSWRKMRLLLLRLLIALKSSRLLAKLSRCVPIAWQIRIKNRLLGARHK